MHDVVWYCTVTPEGFMHLRSIDLPLCFQCVCWIFSFQDWEFPHFMGDLDMNLPGLSTTRLKIRLPLCKRIFKEEYHIHITGKSAHLCLK